MTYDASNVQKKLSKTFRNVQKRLETFRGVQKRSGPSRSVQGRPETFRAVLKLSKDAAKLSTTTAAGRNAFCIAQGSILDSP
jgi:hypothetical protein